MAYCLPKSDAQKLIDALKNGKTIGQGLVEMKRMESGVRREYLTTIIGKENAKDVNTLFEKQLLLKDQKIAMNNFLNEIRGLNDMKRANLVDQIDRMGNILNPSTKKAFLKDIASEKLGTKVTPEEAKEIFDMSQEAKRLRDVMETDPNNPTLWTDYGTQIYRINNKLAEMKGEESRIIDKILAVWNLPRAFMAGFDFSAGGIQLSSMITRKEWWKGQKEQLKYFMDEENYARAQGFILGHPLYQEMKTSGLGMTGLTNILQKNDEIFHSNYLEKANQMFKEAMIKYVPGGKWTPNAVRSFDRAFIGYVNNVRTSAFLNLYQAAKLAGEDVSVGSKNLSDIAKKINVMTGYGTFRNNKGKDQLGKVTPVANVIFWAFRKLVSDFEKINPLTYVTGTKTARNFALKRLLASTMVTGTVMGLAELAGAEFDLDPTSTTVGSVIINGTRYETPGGIPFKVIRFLWRLGSGRMKNLQGTESKVGEGFPAKNRWDNIIEPYFRAKLNPTMSYFMDAAKGTDFLGSPFDPVKGLTDRMAPLTAESFYDVVMNDDQFTPEDILAITTIFGEPTLTPTDITRYDLTVWGTPDGTKNEDGGIENALNEAVKISGVSLRHPPRVINSVKLNDEQHKKYIQISGNWMKALLGQRVQQEDWSSMTPEAQAAIIKSIEKMSRRAGQTALQVDGRANPGENGENDIFTKSLENLQTSGTGTER